MLALLLESSIRITQVIAIAALALQVFRIRSATFRHVIWTAAMAAMLLMPMIVAWAPSIWLRVLPERESPMRSPIVVEMSVAPGAMEATPAPAAATVPSSISISWRTVILSVYGLGVAFLLLRLGAGTLQVRGLLRTSSIDRGHRVHSSCATPITVGWRRPTVILPSSWSEWPTERLQAVMAHEEQHLRRRDPLVQWLALLSRAIFWFHPLAWWLERELASLAEEACDEGVLSQGVAAEDYSNALVFLARAAHETGARIQLGTAMPGPSLYGRLHAILDGPPPQPVSAWRLTGLILAISAAMFVFSTSNLAQEQPKLAYEVATIKPAAPGTPGRMLRLSGPGQVSIKNFTLKDIINWAYSSGTLTIVGGPKWMDSQSPSDSFDIEAKGPADASLTQLRQMMRTLLAERFQMKVHTEQKEVPAYALVPARSDRKLGPNITESTGQPCGDGRPAPPDSSMPRCRAFISPTGLTIEGATMKQIADMLSIPITDLGRPVVDRTNIPGDYKLNLEFTFRTTPNGPKTGEEGPSLFTALQEQLGLKLENAKASIEVLVIDSADRPTEN
jgi:uncharacterized protein (TIGR03435 family)